MAFREKSVGLYEKTVLAFGLSLIMLCFSAAEIFAMEPPRPGEIEKLKAEGKLESRIERAQEVGNYKADPYLLERAKNKLLRRIWKSRGMTESEIDASLPAPPPSWLHMPSTGVVNTFALLIEFNDHRHSNSETNTASELSLNYGLKLSKQWG